MHVPKSHRQPRNHVSEVTIRRTDRIGIQHKFSVCPEGIVRMQPYFGDIETVVFVFHHVCLRALANAKRVGACLACSINTHRCIPSGGIICTKAFQTASLPLAMCSNKSRVAWSGSAAF